MNSLNTLRFELSSLIKKRNAEESSLWFRVLTMEIHKRTVQIKKITNTLRNRKV